MLKHAANCNEHLADYVLPSFEIIRNSNQTYLQQSSVTVKARKLGNIRCDQMTEIRRL